MNIKAITLAAILGVSAPAITDIAINTQTLASPQFPSGNFSDGTWSVSLGFENNALCYRGENLRTGDSLFLAGARASGNSQRRVYTWRNGDTRYQVAWQPSDPGFIRVQVIAPNGREVLNRVLSKN
jgi:hypothetical protein